MSHSYNLRSRKTLSSSVEPKQHKVVKLVKRLKNYKIHPIVTMLQTCNKDFTKMLKLPFNDSMSIKQRAQTLFKKHKYAHLYIRLCLGKRYNANSVFNRLLNTAINKIDENILTINEPSTLYDGTVASESILFKQFLSTKWLEFIRDDLIDFRDKYNQAF